MAAIRRETDAMTFEEEPVHSHQAALLGLSRALGAEYPRWRVVCIDIGAGRQNMRETARRVFEESVDHNLVALRGDRRLVRVFKPLPSAGAPTSAFQEHGAYLILGGTGGLGFALSRHLARTKRARLAWIGKRPAPKGGRGAERINPSRVDPV